MAKAGEEYLSGPSAKADGNSKIRNIKLMIKNCYSIIVNPF